MPFTWLWGSEDRGYAAPTAARVLDIFTGLARHHLTDQRSTPPARCRGPERMPQIGTGEKRHRDEFMAPHWAIGGQLHVLANPHPHLSRGIPLEPDNSHAFPDYFPDRTADSGLIGCAGGPDSPPTKTDRRPRVCAPDTSQPRRAVPKVRWAWNRCRRWRMAPDRRCPPHAGGRNRGFAAGTIATGGLIHQMKTATITGNWPYRSGRIRPGKRGWRPRSLGGRGAGVGVAIVRGVVWGAGRA